MELNATVSADASEANANISGLTCEEADQIARSLLLYKPVQQELTWRSSQTHGSAHRLSLDARLLHDVHVRAGADTAAWDQHRLRQGPSPGVS